MNKYILQMKNIYKSFNNIYALKNASLNVKEGTVHALMGENGAGKSTLMKCLFGIYKKDSGEIIYDGKVININNVKEALDIGIAMVHQELQPIPEMNIAENIFCGRFPLKKYGPISVINHKKMYEDANIYLKEVGIKFDSSYKLGDLSVSQMQSVEIAKAISANAKIIIMDEPTSSLTENEVNCLFNIIKKLKEKGVAIIYISHKMEEILKISDEVTIMRDGSYIGTWESDKLTTEFIIKNMVGRDLTNRFPKKTITPSDVIFQIKNFTSVDEKSFKNVSFELKKGEILGVGGLVGAKRTELMEGIFGMKNISSGTIEYKNKKLTIKKPSQAISKGLAMLTEDRRKTGIFGVLSVSDNISIASLNNYLQFKIIINKNKINEVVDENIKKMNIKTHSKETQVQYLSGGNQQKVIIARWLANSPDVLILDEPTRGIDVGAKYEIYCIMMELVKQGKSIIMISSEMSELIGMSDRIMVMCEGRLTGIIDKKDATQEKIMQLATKFM